MWMPLMPETVSVAALLVALTPALVATHRYRAPFRPSDAPVIESVAVVAPLYGPPLLTLVHETPALVEICHWKDCAPLAGAVSWAVCPAITCWFATCVVK